MGIARGMIKLLMREGSREGFSGTVLTCGKQDIHATGGRLRLWAKQMGFQLHDSGLQNSEILSDKELFRSIGFDNIESIDYSDYEKCTILHDLNNDVPVHLQNRFDVIFDGGTSEHVFNIPKVFENYYKMLKIGGRIIHGLPSSNHVDHGLYMFSPTLFHDYYGANKWEIVDSLFVKYSRKHAVKPWSIYHYIPGSLDSVSYGGLNNGLYAVVFIAKKGKDAICTASVQQGSYKNVSWVSAPISSPNKSGLNLWKKRIGQYLPIWIKDVVNFMKIDLKRPSFTLKLVAKY